MMIMRLKDNYGIKISDFYVVMLTYLLGLTCILELIYLFMYLFI